MAEEVLTTTVEPPMTKDEIRDAVYAEFDVPRDVRPVGAVFGDADRALGSQNTLQHNGAAQPKHLPGLVTTNQVPAQTVALHGPIDGAILLADSWIAHGAELAGEPLRDSEKACLIDQAVEKYAFNMFTCEAAATEAARELGFEPKTRTLEEQIDDETGSQKIDVRFTNGKTMQVKAGRPKFEGCDLRASVTENDDGTLEVKIEKK